MGVAAGGRDLPLPRCQDGGDPRALPPGPAGKAIRTLYMPLWLYYTFDPNNTIMSSFLINQG